MVETTTRSKCVQNTASDVVRPIIEDQIDAALTDNGPRRASVIGREYAQGFAAYVAADNKLYSEPGSISDAEYDALERGHAALYEEILHTPPAIESPSDILVELMLCISDMRNSMGPAGLDLTDAMNNSERLVRLLGLAAGIFGEDLNSLGADAFCVTPGETPDWMPYYEEYLIELAIEKKHAFRLTAHGLVEIYAQQGQGDEDLLKKLDNIKPGPLTTVVQEMIIKRGLSFGIPNRVEGLAGREWWLSERAVKTPMRDAKPLRVIWADNYIDAQLLQACKDFCRVEKAWADAVRALPDHVDDTDDEACVSLAAQRDALIPIIVGTPAKTEAGLRAKAAVYDVYVDGSWNVLLPSPHSDVESPLLATLIADLVRKTAASA
ncbi:hypothetical protein MKW11_14915 [Gluconobacter frateurii]|uniref:hypothetical protein n=1 Tax=Gluconobacter frateurii TaxID=38308 RepID=UPI001F056325|nr:hypothetical protein [Gluconobacter frateurii]UMM08457.1 hypothetical protein MKW11_14915 [Gluconobacter frateurii]